MKKPLIKTIVALLVFNLITFKVLGQLAGTVTINSASTTAGSNYQSFTALANTLNAVGVNGPLVVNVIGNSGPYNEQPVFKQAPGVSATNTITINGNNNLLSFTTTNSAQPWTLLLSGADYMFFNFLNAAGNGTNANVCNLYDDANHNYFNRCSFSCTANGFSGYQNAVSISQSSVIGTTSSTLSSGNNNTFINCKIFSGYYGIRVVGSIGSPYNTNNSFINCEISDWAGYGIYAQFQQNLTVRNCSFDRPSRTALPTLSYGMNFYNSWGGLICQSNCIMNLYGGAPSNTSTTYGVFYDASTSLAGLAANTISNNVINNLGANSTVYGMYMNYLNGSCNGNTIILNNTTTSITSNAYGIYVYPHSNDSARILKNYISITQGGNANKYGIYLAQPGKMLVNYNHFFIASTTGNNYTGYASNLGNAPTFTNWQGGGYDLQGTTYSVNPNFTVISVCGISTATTSTTTVSTYNLESNLGLLKIYPNPNLGEVTIEFKINENYKDKSREIKLIDITGRLILSDLIEQDKIKINMRDYPAGLYFLKITDDISSEVHKIIKD